MSLLVQRTYDSEIVREIMTHPEIWDAVAEDDFTEDKFNIDCHQDCWLLVSDGKRKIGLYNLHAMNHTTLEMHIQILPNYRRKYARKSVPLFYNWVLNEAPKQYKKLIANIPAIYKNVRDFAEENGFTLEGTYTKAYKKNGEIVDLWLLGATTEELKATLCQN